MTEAGTGARFGVVVARFQTPKLHAGHRYLLDTVASKHRELLVVLGDPRTWVGTATNPLDTATRAAMVRHHYPKAHVESVVDRRSDARWSEDLDAAVARHAAAGDAVLYGSRDCFLRYYSGRYRGVELPPFEHHSGTELRLEAVTKPAGTFDFRCGVIYASTTRPRLAYPAVDVAILDRARDRVLLGRKDEDQDDRLRFVGGFVSPDDASFEAAARREAFGETSGIELGPMQYVGSRRIDDWRYRSGGDRIVSMLFVASYVFGHPHGADDLSGVSWVPLADLRARLVEEHQPLGELLLAHLSNEKGASS